MPELVFLNCCHLGTVDIRRRDGNKLAASVARELIDIGVRCVVVAGWAVDDDCAQASSDRPSTSSCCCGGATFGDAVFLARQAVWKRKPSDITWGAFQAYGEPGWLAVPPRAMSRCRAAMDEESPSDTSTNAAAMPSFMHCGARPLFATLALDALTPCTAERRSLAHRDIMP